MQFLVTTAPEREIKFLVTGDIPADAKILHTSLIRQTHLGSEKTVEQLFLTVKSRIRARISYLTSKGMEISNSEELIVEMENLLLATIKTDDKSGRKYNLRVRMEKQGNGDYIYTLTCKKVLSGENSEIREKVEYDIVIPKNIAMLLLGVRKDVLQSIKPRTGVKKRRYYFETPDQHHWCLDRFLGANYGLQTIEVELQHEGKYISPVKGIAPILPSELSTYSMRTLQKKTDKRHKLHSENIDKKKNMVI